MSCTDWRQNETGFPSKSKASREDGRVELDMDGDLDCYGRFPLATGDEGRAASFTAESSVIPACTTLNSLGLARA